MSPKKSISTVTPIATVSRRTRKLEQTVDAIATIAWDLFEKDGFNEVTMENIARAADVAKGTLYKHFPVKEAIVGYRFNQDRARQADKTRKAVLARSGCVARIGERLKIESRYIETKRPYIAAYLQYSLGGSRLVHRSPSAGVFEAFVLELLKAGQTSGEIKTTQSAEHLTEYLSALRLASLIRWLREPASSLVKINRDMLKIFFAGAGQSM